MQPCENKVSKNISDLNLPIPAKAGSNQISWSCGKVYDVGLGTQVRSPEMRVPTNRVTLSLFSVT